MSHLKLALALRQARVGDAAKTQTPNKMSAAQMKASAALYNKVAAKTPGSLLEYAVIEATREAYETAIAAIETEARDAYGALGDGLLTAVEILQKLRGELDG